MFKKKTLVQLTTAAAAILLGASTAYAQTATLDKTDKSTTTTTKSTTKDADAKASTMGSNADAKGGNVTHRDRELMEDLAHANIAEIDTGKMALEKAVRADVKKFAQKMVDDHTKALNELQALAEKKGVTLPTETDLPHKTVAKGLDALSGDAFDKQYIARVGVGDHERTHKLLDKTVKSAKDPDLKAYAQKTIKAVDQHLAMGRKMKGDTKATTKTTTKSSDTSDMSVTKGTDNK